jgi:hypothetical protein
MAIFPNPDVPVLVETPNRPYFQMVRCHYISVECNDPRPEWQINLGGQPMPFLMLGLVGIIQQPFDAPRFNTYGLIDQLFAGIEARADLLINFNDIWLPGFLFKADPGVGDVYRVVNELFTWAYRFRDGQSNKTDFEENCRRLHGIAFSEDETRAFKDWSAEQISGAQKRPPKNPELKLQTKLGF